MANNLTNNPLRCDTAGLIIRNAEGVLVTSMQWVNDGGAAGGAIADGDDISMNINGVTVGLRCAIAESLSGGIGWSVTFPQPMRIYILDVTVIEGGTLLIWKA